MQDKNIHIELEEIQIQAEQLESFLLMLEQSLIYNNFGGEIFLPGVSHMTEIANKITNRLTDLTQATSLNDKEIA